RGTDRSPREHATYIFGYVPFTESRVSRVPIRGITPLVFSVAPHATPPGRAGGRYGANLPHKHTPRSGARQSNAGSAPSDPVPGGWDPVARGSGAAEQSGGCSAAPESFFVRGCTERRRARPRPSAALPGPVGGTGRGAGRHEGGAASRRESTRLHSS